MGKPEGRRPLGRPRRRWVDNIRSCWGNRRERDNWGDLGVDGWIILGLGGETGGKETTGET